VNAEKFRSILREFNIAEPDVEASAVITVDGIPIVSMPGAGMNEDGAGAMGAALLAVGERTAAELKRGPLEFVMIKGAEGFVFTSAIDGNTFLVVVTKTTVKLGILFIDLGRVREQLIAAMN
jgi:predicted regulator of Ras-like GTPase activity (Roadblock/LC7/MglB family)